MWEFARDTELAKGERPVNEFEEGVTIEDRFQDADRALEGATGTEELDALPLDKLLPEYLGLKNEEEVRGVNGQIALDQISLVDRWADAVMYQSSATLQPLRFDHLQWTGVIKGFKNVFAENPIPTLNIDDVGSGKTFQAFLRIAQEASFRKYHAKEGKFPGNAFGTFGELATSTVTDIIPAADAKWPKYAKTVEGLKPIAEPLAPAQPGGIPEMPTIIVVPVPLMGQWESEAHRMLHKDAWEVLPYPTMAAEAKKAFWTHTVPEAGRHRHGLGRVIILASYEAIKRDFSALYMPSTAWAPTWVARRGTRAGVLDIAHTVFSHRYTTVIVDEVHLAKGIKTAAHQGIAILACGTPSVLGMSATPIVTDPMDLANIGRMLNVPRFVGEGAAFVFKDIAKSLKSTKSKANKAARDKTAKLDRAAGHGGVDKRDLDVAKNALLTLKTAQDLRARFGDSCLRRVPTAIGNVLSESDEDKYPPRPIEGLIRLTPTENEQMVVNLQLAAAADKEHVTTHSVSRYSVYSTVANHTIGLLLGSSSRCQPPDGAESSTAGTLHLPGDGAGVGGQPERQDQRAHRPRQRPPQAQRGRHHVQEPGVLRPSRARARPRGHRGTCRRERRQRR
jgi:hypothetical protein